MFVFIFIVLAPVYNATIQLSDQWGAPVGLCSFIDFQNLKIDELLPYKCIGVNHPAIVREIPQIWYFPAFPHFFQNIPHF